MDSHLRVFPLMFDGAQVRALAVPLEDIQRVDSKPPLHCLGCLLFHCPVGRQTLAQSEVLSALDQVFIKDISVLCSVQLSLNPDQSPSPATEAATTMLHRWDGIRQVMSGPPNMTLRIGAKQFNVGFIKTPCGLSCVFLCGEASIWPLKPRSVESCSECCRSGSFFNFHTGFLELSQSDHWVLCHLSYQVPSPLIAQFGWAASSRKSTGCSKLLPFKNHGVHCALGNLQ